MTYQCMACSYTGSRFPGGVCPGCGSVHIKNLATERGKKPVAGRPYRLALAVALWIYLVFELWRKLS